MYTKVSLKPLKLLLEMVVGLLSLGMPYSHWALIQEGWGEVTGTGKPCQVARCQFQRERVTCKAFVELQNRFLHHPMPNLKVLEISPGLATYIVQSITNVLHIIFC